MFMAFLSCYARVHYPIYMNLGTQLSCSDFFLNQLLKYLHKKVELLPTANMINVDSDKVKQSTVPS